MDILTGVLNCITDPTFLLLTFLGAAAGLFVGAIPGLSVSMATALLVSVTYTWQTENALATIMGVYVVGVFSGAISAILINIPGAPASVVTTIDGYPMAKKGEAYRALKYAVVYSFVGTAAGFIALSIAIKPVSAIALKFNPMDYFLLGVFGLLTVGALTSKNMTKGLISAAMGLTLSLVGLDSVWGTPRLTFGSFNLQTGISIVPALIGFFGFTEVLWVLSHGAASKESIPLNKEKVSMREILSHLPSSFMSCVIGTLIGALPGAGAPVASFIAYGRAKRKVKNPEVPFGEGAPEGIVAGESANNACIGGALIPMLTLGVPGDAVTAIILSVFYVHGLRPGPMFISTSPKYFGAILAGGFLGSIFLLALGLYIAPKICRLINIPKEIMMPIVAALCVIGAYGCAGRWFDVGLMLCFGLAGFIMRKREYPIAPMILGLVLGGMMDSNFRRAVSLSISEDNFMAAMFGRPITLILLFLIACAVIMSIIKMKKAKAE